MKEENQEKIIIFHPGNDEECFCGIKSFSHEHHPGRPLKDFVRISEMSTELKGLATACCCHLPKPKCYINCDSGDPKMCTKCNPNKL